MEIKSFTLPELYSTDESHRYQKIRSVFVQAYNTAPQFYVRAPGRVNLIGEHIDYEGYGVLPFAIEKDCLIAGRIIQEPLIHITHTNPGFPSTVISNNPEQKIDYIDPYLKYMFAGYSATTKQAQNLSDIPQDLKNAWAAMKFRGLQLVVSGNVPIAAGLSSSSSFCVCCALLAVRANNIAPFMNKNNMIDQVIRYERSIGVNAGGMDQSISILGEKQVCLFIEFEPIRSRKVVLPQGYKFVIMNSLEESKKLETLGTRYNKRVCECRLALHLLCRKLKIDRKVSDKWKVLRELQQYLNIDIDNMGRIVDQFLPRKDYTLLDLYNELGVAAEVYIGDLGNYEIVMESNTHYRLYEAAKHVYEEAARVLRFIEICNSQLPLESKAETLGRLMNESQKSCKELYNCSSTLIDEITTMALEYGALGSRLTGAGWGGCTVSMVHGDRVKSFISQMKQRFYSREQFAKQIQEEGIDNIIFETIPAHGASYVQYP